MLPSFLLLGVGCNQNDFALTLRTDLEDIPITKEKIITTCKPDRADICTTFIDAADKSECDSLTSGAQDIFGQKVLEVLPENIGLDEWENGNTPATIYSIYAQGDLLPGNGTSGLLELSSGDQTRVYDDYTEDTSILLMGGAPEINLSRIRCEGWTGTLNYENPTNGLLWSTEVYMENDHESLDWLQPVYSYNMYYGWFESETVTITNTYVDADGQLISKFMQCNSTGQREDGSSIPICDIDQFKVAVEENSESIIGIAKESSIDDVPEDVTGERSYGFYFLE